MIGKLIQKTLVVVSLLGTTFTGVQAQQTKSLLGIEGGMSTLRADTYITGYEIKQSSMGHFGLKLGAEGENFRVFFSARNYLPDGENKLITAGVEAQYKFNFSKPVNLFIGANAGSAYIEVGPSSDGAYPGTNVTTPYFGGDIGLNYHASELVDLELGAKYMLVDKSVTQGQITYDFRDLTSFYASVIFKWQMD